MFALLDGQIKDEKDETGYGCAFCCGDNNDDENEDVSGVSLYLVHISVVGTARGILYACTRPIVQLDYALSNERNDTCYIIFHVIRYDLLFLFCLGTIASLDILQFKKKN